MFDTLCPILTTISDFLLAGLNNYKFFVPQFGVDIFFNYSNQKPSKWM